MKPRHRTRGGGPSNSAPPHAASADQVPGSAARRSYASDGFASRSDSRRGIIGRRRPLPLWRRTVRDRKADAHAWIWEGWYDPCRQLSVFPDAKSQETRRRTFGDRGKARGQGAVHAFFHGKEQCSQGLREGEGEQRAQSNDRSTSKHADSWLVRSILAANVDGRESRSVLTVALARARSSSPTPRCWMRRPCTTC